MATKNDILDLYFMDARSKLIDLAAFLDRVERQPGEADFRIDAFSDALAAMLTAEGTPRTEAVLKSLSDLSTEPVDRAPYQGAIGATPPQSSQKS